MSAKPVTRVQCSVCGWVWNVSMRDTEGPVRRLHRHWYEEHSRNLLDLDEANGGDGWQRAMSVAGQEALGDASVPETAVNGLAAAGGVVEWPADLPRPVPATALRGTCPTCGGPTRLDRRAHFCAACNAYVEAAS